MKNPFANLFKKKAKAGEKNITHQPSEKKKKKKGLSFYDKFLKTKEGKSTDQGKEIIGEEILPLEIR